MVLIIAAALSFTLLADWSAETENRMRTIQSIEDKTQTVLRLSAGAAAASAGVSAIPGDTATPIADKLADFSEYFLLVLCVLYAEKFLVTLTGLAAFRILIPIALVLFTVALFFSSEWTERAQRVAIKLGIFGLVLAFLIPVSIRTADVVYNSYENSVEIAISEADEFADTTGALNQAEGDENFIQQIFNQLSETASHLVERATDVLNNFVQTLAVLIVTTCVIPIFTLLFFLWVLKALFGLRLPVSMVLPGKLHRRIPNLPSTKGDAE